MRGTKSERTRLLESEKKKKNYYKYFSQAIYFNFDQNVKNDNLLKAIKPKNKQCYLFIKIIIEQIIEQ